MSNQTPEPSKHTEPTPTPAEMVNEDYLNDPANAAEIAALWDQIEARQQAADKKNKLR